MNARTWPMTGRAGRPSMTDGTAVPADNDTPAQPNGGRLGLAALAAWIELRSCARSGEFMVGVIAIPVILYAMFGLPNGTALEGGTPIRLTSLVGICAYGIVSLAIFTFGQSVAEERGRGWTRALRATPMPTAVMLAAKTASALVHGTLIVVALGVLAATAGQVDLSPGEWLAFGATMISGVVVFSPLGFAIAFLARPRAADTITNLIFLPLAFASGFFIPLSELPGFMRTTAPWLPTYHFGQLGYRIVMPANDVEELTGIATGPIVGHLAVIIATAAALAAIALAAARREAVTRRS